MSKSSRWGPQPWEWYAAYMECARKWALGSVLRIDRKQQPYSPESISAAYRLCHQGYSDEDLQERGFAEAIAATARKIYEHRLFKGPLLPDADQRQQPIEIGEGPLAGLYLAVPDRVETGENGPTPRHFIYAGSEVDESRTWRWRYQGRLLGEAAACGSKGVVIDAVFGQKMEVKETTVEASETELRMHASAVLGVVDRTEQIEIGKNDIKGALSQPPTLTSCVRDGNECVFYGLCFRGERDKYVRRREPRRSPERT